VFKVLILLIYVSGRCPLLRVKNTAYRVATCLENLEMSGNVTAVREMSRILLKVRELSGKKSC